MFRCTSAVLLGLLCWCCDGAAAAETMYLSTNDSSVYHLQVLAVGVPGKMTIGWHDPIDYLDELTGYPIDLVDKLIEESLHHYEVEYNFTLHYHTSVGERNYSEAGAVNVTTDTAFIPFYGINSSYHIRITKVTTKRNRIVSSVLVLDRSAFENSSRSLVFDSIKFFRVSLNGLEGCEVLNREEDYHSDVKAVRREVKERIQTICSNNSCDFTLKHDQLVCYNSTLTYIGMLVSCSAPASTVLSQLTDSLQSPLNIALRSDLLYTAATCCAIASLGETPHCLYSEEVIVVPDDTNPVNRTVDHGNRDQNDSDHDQGDGDGSYQDDNNSDDVKDGTTSDDSVGLVVAVAIGSSFGVIMITLCVVCLMMMYSSCCCHSPHRNMDVEGSLVKTYSLSSQDGYSSKLFAPVNPHWNRRQPTLLPGYSISPSPDSATQSSHSSN